MIVGDNVNRILQIVTDNDNITSRFTITPTRLTIKIARQDLYDTKWFVDLGIKVAKQIDYSGSLRGRVIKDRYSFTLSNQARTKDKRVTYKFKTLSGELLSSNT